MYLVRQKMKICKKKNSHKNNIKSLGIITRLDNPVT